MKKRMKLLQVLQNQNRIELLTCAYDQALASEFQLINGAISYEHKAPIRSNTFFLSSTLT